MLLMRPVNHLVINVSKILHEIYFIAYMLKIAAQHIKDYERPRIANVKIIIDSRPARVERDLFFIFFKFLQRNKLFFLTG